MRILFIFEVRSIRDKEFLRVLFTFYVNILEKRVKAFFVYVFSDVVTYRYRINTFAIVFLHGYL